FVAGEQGHQIQDSAQNKSCRLPQQLSQEKKRCADGTVKQQTGQNDGENQKDESQVVAADPVRQLIHPVTAAAHQKIDLRLVSRQLMNSQNSEQHQRQ